MMVQRFQYVQWIGAGLIGCMLGLGGCSSGKAPTAPLSQAELAVEEANQSEASQYASLDLQTARDHLENAKQAMQQENYQEARRQAEKALVNAQLAETKAEAASAREAAVELRKSIESLRREAERASMKN
jgi:Domain of unknown function (DUF4398)